MIWKPLSLTKLEIFFVLKSISNDNFHYLCPELVSDEHFCHLD
ncbi:hypothetical protein HMPREF2531_00096 [Bacteroides intestinalis]|uniref:Uncharacterized protein n=1 Tax=Bacteroides intestinalis TaxID=329854 RepID=A0A139LVM7_9BACE|nr:hypothetical protein HMPREF2531_00096 [Bacteroides intestinalis]